LSRRERETDVQLTLVPSGRGWRIGQDPELIRVGIFRNVIAQTQRSSGIKNSTPIFSPDRHTNRHRRGVFGGKTKVNSAGMAFVPEIDTHAPPADRLFNMPRSHGESSSNFSLTVRFAGSRWLLRRSTGNREKRGKDIADRSPWRHHHHGREWYKQLIRESWTAGSGRCGANPKHPLSIRNPASHGKISRGLMMRASLAFSAALRQAEQPAPFYWKLMVEKKLWLQGAVSIKN
jgi:hypothetical protein